MGIMGQGTSCAKALLMFLGSVRRSESPGHRRDARLAWIEHRELVEHGRDGDPVQGPESSWGKASASVYVGDGPRPGATGQALTVSMGIVPEDCTAQSFPGGPHGNPGEASGEWSHCGLSGSGEQEGRYCMGGGRWV